MKQPQLRYLAAWPCLVLAIVSGCSSGEQAGSGTDDHGHSHGHSEYPLTLPAAIAGVRDMWTDISTAMDNNDPDAAHDELHDIGLLLHSMPDLAAHTDLSEEDWNQIDETVDALFDAFSNIDSEMHEGEADGLAAYESAKSTIEEGVAALEAKLPLLGEVLSAGGHDPDDHQDHEDDAEHNGEDSPAEE